MRKLTEDMVNQLLFVKGNEQKKILLKGYFPHSVVDVRTQPNGNIFIAVDDESTELKVYKTN